MRSVAYCIIQSLYHIRLRFEWCFLAILVHCVQCFSDKELLLLICGNVMFAIVDERHYILKYLYVKCIIYARTIR